MAYNQQKQQQQQQNQQIQELQKKSSREGDRIKTGQASQLSQQNGGQSGPSAMMGSKIARLQETGIIYAKKIEVENKKLERLDKEIEEYEIILKIKRNELMEKRKGTKQKYEIGITETDAYDANILKTKLKSMNNKIETQKVKLNEAFCKNKSLKDQINFLRREKIIFSEIQVQLEENIEIKQKELENLKEIIKTNRKTSEQSKDSLHKLKIDNNLHKRIFEKEFAEVFKILDTQNRNERKNERFGKKSSTADTNEQMSPPHQANTKHEEDFQNSKKKNLKDLRKTNYKDFDQQLEEKKRSVNEYEIVLQQLIQETNSKNMNDIVDKFVDYEDHNNTLFNYINQLRDESENLKRQKNSLEQELEELQLKPKLVKDDKKNQKFEKIKEEIKIVKDKRILHEKEGKNLQQIINKLKISIPIMFDRIGCNSQEYTRELGEDIKSMKDIEEGNMLQFLAIIEKRTNDLLQLYNEAYNPKQDQKNQKGGMLEDSNVSASNIGANKVKPDDQITEEIKNSLDQLEKQYEQQKEYRQNSPEKIIEEKNYMTKDEFDKKAESLIKQIQDGKKKFKK